MGSAIKSLGPQTTTVPWHQLHICSGFHYIFTPTSSSDYTSDINVCFCLWSCFSFFKYRFGIVSLTLFDIENTGEMGFNMWHNWLSGGKSSLTTHFKEWHCINPCFFFFTIKSTYLVKLSCNRGGRKNNRTVLDKKPCGFSWSRSLRVTLSHVTLHLLLQNCQKCCTSSDALWLVSVSASIDDVLARDAGECVICLEELQQGDTIARLPCLCIYHKRWLTHSHTRPHVWVIVHCFCLHS